MLFTVDAIYTLVQYFVNVLNKIFIYNSIIMMVHG